MRSQEKPGRAYAKVFVKGTNGYSVFDHDDMIYSALHTIAKYTTPFCCDSNNMYSQQWNSFHNYS